MLRTLLCLLILSAGVLSQTPATQQQLSTSFVSCVESPVGNKTARSEVLISPDAKYRAYVEAESRAVAREKAAPNRPPCANNSRLFLKEDAAAYQLISLETPLDLESGNGLRLVDWSADSRRLLIERTRWQFESEGEIHSVQIYDTRTSLFQEPDLDRMAHKLFVPNCALNIHVLGFTTDGNVLLEAQPLTPEEEEVGAQQSCVRKNTRWKLAPAAEKLEPVDGPATVQKFGRTEAQAQ